MSSPRTFRFLDLPQELQMMVLENHYTAYNISVSIRAYSRTLHITGLPSSRRNIELVSRTLHKLATPIFKRAFTGVLIFAINDDEKPQALEKFCGRRRYAWIRERVTMLEMAGYKGRWSRRIRMSVIKCITSQFPVLQTISLNYVNQKQAYHGCLESASTAWWTATNTRLYKNTFLNGSRDGKYESPVHKLEAQFLAKALAVSGMHHVKVLVNSSVWWQTPRGGLLLMVAVSFQVTPDGWSVVDRDWRTGGELDRSRSTVCSSDTFQGCMRMAKTLRKVSDEILAEFLVFGDDSD